MPDTDTELITLRAERDAAGKELNNLHAEIARLEAKLEKADAVIISLEYLRLDLHPDAHPYGPLSCPYVGCADARAKLAAYRDC